MNRPMCQEKGQKALVGHHSAPERHSGVGTRPTCVSLFSGGGLADVGYRSAGFELVGAVEFDPKIAAWYVRNLGEHCVVSDVAAVDFSRWVRATLLHVSPPCTNASVANQGAVETEQDRENGRAVCLALREIRPRWFVLENVAPYAKFQAFADICAELRSLGYTFECETLNSADYGVPQTRKRLILRAVLGGNVPSLEPTHAKGGKSGGLFSELDRAPWNGWYGAIEDLVPGLPEGKLAKWQLERLPEWLKTCLVPGVLSGCDIPREAHEPSSCVVSSPKTSAPKAVLVESKNANQQWGDGYRDPSEPATSVVTDGKESHRPKAVLCQLQPNARGAWRPGDEPAKTITAEDAPAQHNAVLIGNQQGSQNGDGRAPQIASQGEPAPPVTASQHGKGKMPQAVLCDGNGNRSRLPTVLQDEQPAMTVQAWHGRRPCCAPTAISTARVVTITPRCLARFQTLPDWYVLPSDELPKGNALSCKIIGNGVPCLLTQRIGEAFLRGAK